MLEGELEAAICRAFPLLLPDLHRAGYQISQQAVLLGRRIDLLLQTQDGCACIIELKAGTPPMPHVRNQILDYAACWQASYPGQPRRRLIVIANTIPKATELELANFGIESRTITATDLLAALELFIPDKPIEKGRKLAPDDDIARVRHLLSDYDAIKIPTSIVLGRPWDHEKVFLGLVSRGEKHKELWKKNIYVQLYPQNRNCAVLYGPRVAPTQHAPLHINRQRASWDAATFDKIEPFIERTGSDNKGPGRELNNFDHYRVKDWDRFAVSIGL